MAGYACDKLTERQKACLRLVREGFTTKEIAGQLGTSPDAIDKSIKLAMAKLGVDRRGVAARMLYERERQTGYLQLGPQPPDLSAAPKSDEVAPSPRDEVMSPTVREERASFDATHSPMPLIAKDEEEGGSLKRTIGKVLEWVTRAAGVILMIIALAYFGTVVARYHEEAHHLRPR